MTRSTINFIYLAFLIAMTIIFPALLWIGSDGSWEGILGALLSFGVMVSYVIYTVLLGARNS